MALVQKALEVSERWACRALGLARASQRSEAERPDQDRPPGLSPSGAGSSTGLWCWHENPRYGYRRIWALLRREAWRINRKRVHRLVEGWSPESACSATQTPAIAVQREREHAQASGAPEPCMGL